MKFTESMMREFVQTKLTAREIADLLTMTGFEMESIDVVEGEVVLDINIMANRGDGASVFGLAREILAKDPDAQPTELYLQAANRFTREEEQARSIWEKTSVVVESENCTRFACRLFEGVTNGESPEWLQARLRRIGQRPISLLVDLANYVMFEVGQPLHTFDFDTLAGHRIIVRQANQGERFTTLDETDHELRTNHLMVCDEKQPAGVAGVMGGLKSEASATTTRCLLESAHFDSQSIRKTRKQLGLNTEASYRFERHVDPCGVVAALNRFADLLEQCGGPKPVPGVIDVWPRKPESKTVTLRMNRCDRLLGMAVPPEQAAEYLTKLGFEVAPVGPRTFEVTPPTWRIDVVREDDLIEEVGRVHGYQHIPEILPIGQTPLGGSHGTDRFVELATEFMLRVGFDESVSHSLGDRHPLDSEGGTVKVLDPHSPDMAQLRNSLLPHLARAAAKNGGANFARFEVGRVFQPEAESLHLAAIAHGVTRQPHWQAAPGQDYDFFALKGITERLFESLGAKVAFRETKDARFHPTRCAAVFSGENQVGILGELHPDKCDDSGISARTVAFELFLSQSESFEKVEMTFVSLSKNPAARRDVSAVFSKKVAFEEIEQAIRNARMELLEKFWLFDVYEGAGVEEGSRSLSFGLQIRKFGANLTDVEANAVRDQFVAVLESVGGQLR